MNVSCFESPSRAKVTYGCTYGYLRVGTVRTLTASNLPLLVSALPGLIPSTALGTSHDPLIEDSLRTEIAYGRACAPSAPLSLAQCQA